MACRGRTQLCTSRTDSHWSTLLLHHKCKGRLDGQGMFWAAWRLPPHARPPSTSSSFNTSPLSTYYFIVYTAMYKYTCLFFFSLIPGCHLHNYGPARRQRTASRRGQAADWGGTRPLPSVTQLPWATAGGREAALPLREAPWTHRGLLTSMTTGFFGLLTLHCGASLPSLPHGLF